MSRNRYILEINPDIAKSIVVFSMVGERGITAAFKIDDLEELNSDYINEHYGDLQDTAYKKGLHDGESKCRYCNEYQRGLNDAWEAARKVALNSNDGGLSIEKLDEIFDRYTLQQVLKEYTAKQTIEKLKSYEEKQKADEIKVGDEVRGINGNEKLVITAIESEYDHCVVMTKRGGYYTANLSSLVKTGRHFDIASILKEMQS